jgi:hypothetical protein
MVLKERKERDKSKGVAIKGHHRAGYDVQPHNSMHNLFIFLLASSPVLYRNCKSYNVSVLQ